MYCTKYVCTYGRYLKGQRVQITYRHDQSFGIKENSLEWRYLWRYETRYISSSSSSIIINLLLLLLGPQLWAPCKAGTHIESICDMQTAMRCDVLRRKLQDHMSMKVLTGCWVSAFVYLSDCRRYLWKAEQGGGVWFQVATELACQISFIIIVTIIMIYFIACLHQRSKEESKSSLSTKYLISDILISKDWIFLLGKVLT